MDYKALLFVARFCYARARGSTGLLYIVATIMTLPKPKMMMRLRKERKLSYIRVNSTSEFPAGNGDFSLTGTAYTSFLVNAIFMVLGKNRVNQVRRYQFIQNQVKSRLVKKILFQSSC